MRFIVIQAVNPTNKKQICEKFLTLPKIKNAMLKKSIDFAYFSSSLRAVAKQSYKVSLLENFTFI